MKWTNGIGKWLAMGGVVLATGACLTRPVGQQPPTTKVSFTTAVSQQKVDKIDLLFMIDNSASMGDKQAILAEAVPNLLQGLLKPACVKADGTPTAGAERADPAGASPGFGCPADSEPEFRPISDMHIGVISSSLGGLGGDVCPDANSAASRTNDRGHLLNIAQGGGTVAEASPANFLSWYPSVEANNDKKRHPDPVTTPVGDLTKLSQLFSSLVVGVGQNGCGLEAQLESIYHFLIAPDPWDKVQINAQSIAELTGVDTLLLQQRADFLRPDSLVAIIALTDEDDSSADPLSVNGQGWYFMANQFAGSNTTRKDGQTTTAPRASSACKTDPGSDNCQSCAFASRCTTESWCQQLKADPECAVNGGFYGSDEESLNVRFHRMKERFGVDPQYPLKRYIDGFTLPRVPDRTTEHPTTNGKIDGYTGTPKCTNPLFAAKLPRNAGDDLCNLPVGTRSRELVYFAVVGGVPSSLLPAPGTDTAPNWDKILGRAPEKFDYTGIDPHMIQSVSPRQGLPGPSTTFGDNGSDPDHGREWDTKKDDLQYACTFDLPAARNCAGVTSCDCDGVKNPPLCGPAPGTSQVKAKAYPTIREFMVVRALQQNGIIASLCPITLDPTKKQDLTYGYNPAVAAIVNRLKNALTSACLPQQLTREEATNKVPCLILATLPDANDSCSRFGLAEPDPEILKVFREDQKREQGSTAGGALDTSTLPVCVVEQETVAAGQSCKDSPEIRWCYVENTADQQPAGRTCEQAVLFSAGADQLAGARFSLQCIQQFNQSSTPAP